MQLAFAFSLLLAQALSTITATRNLQVALEAAEGFIPSGGAINAPSARLRRHSSELSSSRSRRPHTMRMAAGFPVNNADANQVAKVEVFMDMICPFCAKISNTLIKEVAPRFPSVQFVYHHYVQPWHWQASTLGQAAIVAYMLDSAPGKPNYVALVQQLFAQRDLFVDQAVEGESKAQVADKIVKIAADVGFNAEQFKTYMTSGTPENDMVVKEQKLHTKHPRDTDSDCQRPRGQRDIIGLDHAAVV